MSFDLPPQARERKAIVNKLDWVKLVASLVAQAVENPPAMQETQIRSLGWENPLEKEMATHSSILPGKSHGQGKLAGYSPQGHKTVR